MPSGDAQLSAASRRILADVALRSIETGLEGGGPLPLEASAYPRELREIRASFVTLRMGGELRGCVGALEPRWPLVEDVARSAHNAAFGDPRFARLAAGELVGLEIHISVLSPLERMEVTSRADLISQLRPEIDGLLLEQGPHRGTFLPSVWESLREPQAFVAALERKAGLPADAWSEPVECFRYTTEEWTC